MEISSDGGTHYLNLLEGRAYSGFGIDEVVEKRDDPPPMDSFR